MVKISPKYIQKQHWLYQNLIRPEIKKRLNLLLHYAGYSTDDLAFLLGIPPEEADEYLNDCSYITVFHFWLIGQLCNVSIDYFTNTAFWFTQLHKDNNIK